MPTPKQVRYHYARVSRLYTRLQGALYQAQDAHVVHFEDFNQSPRTDVFKSESKFEAATKDALAEAMRKEIISKI